LQISIKNHPTVKYTLHYSALILSIGSVWYTLFQISTNPIMQGFFTFFALLVEVAAQYFRGLAKSYSKIGKYGRAAGLWLIYLIYIVIFAGLSAVIVFKGEIDLNKQSAQNANTALTSKQASLKEYREDLAYQKLQREEEKQTGRGPKYDAIEAKIVVDEAEIKRLENEIDAAGKNPEVYKGSSFNSLSDTLIIIMFCSAVIIIYLILILTPWDIELEEDTANTNSEAEAFHKNPPFDTDNEPNYNSRIINLDDRKLSVSEPENNRHCLYCGNTLADDMRVDAKYCDENCKLKYNRKKKLIT
jgi:uncharacterized membrane protein